VSTSHPVEFLLLVPTFSTSIQAASGIQAASSSIGQHWAGCKRLAMAAAASRTERQHQARREEASERAQAGWPYAAAVEPAAAVHGIGPQKKLWNGR
jgi:hypothetical protein